MASLNQRSLIRRITKQSAQGCQVKGIKPYTINSRSASRHHTDSPGASTAREKGFAGPAQERRDSGTLYETACNCPRRPWRGLKNVYTDKY